MNKFLLMLMIALVALSLAACEGKKSLDGHPMDKPPPSAYAPRDSEPQLYAPKESAGAAGATSDAAKK